jgi:hypothetical protein
VGFCQDACAAGVIGRNHLDVNSTCFFKTTPQIWGVIETGLRVSDKTCLVSSTRRAENEQTSMYAFSAAWRSCPVADRQPPVCYGA